MPFFGSLGILITRALVVAAVVVYLFSEISTLVGSGVPGYFDGSILFNTPYGVAVDSEGNVYVADYFNNCVRRITPAGVVTTLAGQATAGFLDGTGTNAQFNKPTGIAVDSSNNVYVIDRTNNSVRRITPAGVVTTLAGQTTAGSADGTGTNASFTGLFGIAVNSSGDIFVCEDSAGSNRIRKITSTGVVTTFVSSGLRSPSGMVFNSAGELYVTNATNHYISKVSPEGVVTNIAGAGSATVNGGGAAVDGTGTNAVFFTPLGAGVDSAGNVYIADGNNNRIRKMTPAGVVTTLAGSGSATFGNGTGTNASFSYPFGIAVDSTGNVYVGDANNHRIRKISPAGLVTTLAGSGVAGFTDSLQTNFRFSLPIGLAFDSAGNLYVGEIGNHTIRRITPAGLVSTFAGTGAAGFADGIGTNIIFNNPYGVAFDSAGIMYVADSGNNRIRKITPGGVVSTFAGSGTYTFADGDGTNASFRFPTGIALDSVGNVYVADAYNNRIRKITPAGVVSTLAGSGTGAGTGTGAFADGAGTNASFNTPGGIAVDSTGNVFVADQANHRIRRITPLGVVSTFAGSAFGSTDANGTNASFNNPKALAFDSAGNLYVGEENHRIRRITPLGVVSTFAGSSIGFQDGTGTSALFFSPQGIAIDSSGTLFVADNANNCIRRITTGGVVSTFVGSQTSGYSDGGWFTRPVGVATDWDGTIYVADRDNQRIRKISPLGVASTFSGNGTANTATFNTPLGVAVNSVRTVYVADSTNCRIRAITAEGVASTFAGSGTSGFADGTGTSATFNTPVGITVDPAGIVYVSDIGNHRIRRITSAGVVTTLAGTTQGFQDGVGTNARFNTPSGVVADIYGNVYVADTNNHRIRRIASDGTVTTLAGQATPGYADGTGSSAQFNFPYHLSIDALGILYVADQTNNRIRTVQTSTGVVSTLAGDGTAGFTPSRFSSPQGITVDRFRNAYVADTGNHSIRKIPNAFTLPQNNGAANTIAGDGTAGFLAGNGIGARVNLPRGVGVDSVGNVYVGDLLNHRIRKITPAGVVTVLAGSGSATFANGTGAGASFSSPWGVAADSQGNIYVGDLNTHRIRKISPAGVVTTLAGSGTATFADGTGAGASFNGPQQVAVDREGNVYVADGNNFRIRKITPSGVVSTLAGSGTATVTDGVGTSASFGSPQGVTVDSEGVVYVADYAGHRIRRISTVGVVTTIAGSTQGSANGTGTSAQFNFPRGITVDTAGNLYVADESNHRIRKITPAGVVTTLAGTTQGFQDGIGTDARFNFPVGMSVDSVGNVYVGDRTNNRIRKIGTAVAQLPLNRGVVTRLAGSGLTGSTDGTGTNARFNNPYGMTVDSVGNIFVADVTNHRIRRITPLGVVSTFAGSGTPGTINATGTNAQFNGPAGVAVDSAGNVYVGDQNNNRIRKITSLGVVSTLAGSGTPGFADAGGVSAAFNVPAGVAVDSTGNVYVADTTNNRIRRITPGGVVTTFAGQATGGFLDGTGTNARFNYPYSVAVDSSGFVYVADQTNRRIRKITPLGVVTTLAGNGTAASADGTGTNASFITPYGITVNSEGVVYLADQNARRIRAISPAGVVTTLAGNGTSSSIDGIGTNATFQGPGGVTVDSGGIVYVGESSGNLIRKIQ
jgi:mucin-19